MGSRKIYSRTFYERYLFILDVHANIYKMAIGIYLSIHFGHYLKYTTKWVQHGFLVLASQ